MPCHSKLKKDAPNCEKLREAVRKRRSGGTADEVWSHHKIRESRYENYKDWKPNQQ